MRLLILSNEIDSNQKFGRSKYNPPYDVVLETGDLNDVDNFQYSVFDYDVAIIHIVEPTHHSIGYYNNLPKLQIDAKLALQNGRTIICLPGSQNFWSDKTGNRGMQAYSWLEEFGVVLQNNSGNNIVTSGAGKANVIQIYLNYAPKYYQIFISPEISPINRLAIVSNTDLVVGFEQSIGSGTLVILPPPRITTDNYLMVMSAIVNVARRYYDKSQKSIPIVDQPEWISEHVVARVKILDDQIRELSDEKAEFDELAYVLYGTGNALENSVALMLEKLGITVENQPQGSNIDLIAKHPTLNIGLAVEVTGIKTIVQKDSPKIAQAWQYLSEREGTPEESDRLIIIANTQYHLKPSERNPNPFSQNVTSLLGKHDVLLMTTTQLYDLWKVVYEGKMKAEDAILELHKQTGIFHFPILSDHED